MAETLGTLCDKLTIVKLKQWHSEDRARLDSLAGQEKQLLAEIDEFVADAMSGAIPTARLSFAANKVYKVEGNEIRPIEGSVGHIIGELAAVNTRLWHEQEKVYDFPNVPNDQKNEVIKQLALLNLERNKCIDQIDLGFKSMVERKTSNTR